MTAATPIGDYTRGQISGWATVNNAKQSTMGTLTAKCADGDFTQTSNISIGLRSINLGSSDSNTNLYVLIETVKINAMAGATTLEKFNNYLTTYPITNLSIQPTP